MEGARWRAALLRGSRFLICGFIIHCCIQWMYFVILQSCLNTGKGKRLFHCTQCWGWIGLILDGFILGLENAFCDFSTTYLCGGCLCGKGCLGEIRKSSLQREMLVGALFLQKCIVQNSNDTYNSAQISVFLVRGVVEWVLGNENTCPQAISLVNEKTKQTLAYLQTIARSAKWRLPLQMSAEYLIVAPSLPSALSASVDDLGALCSAIIHVLRS